MGILDITNSILDGDFIDRKNVQDQINIGGFTAFGLGSSSLMFNSVITEKLINKNVYATENITLDPLSISFAGDIADIFIEKKIDSYFDSAKNIINIINPYLPIRSQSVIDKIFVLTDTIRNASTLISSSITQVQDILSQFGDKTGSLSLQEEFIEILINLHTTLAVIDLEFNNKIYKNMRIVKNVVTSNKESQRIVFEIVAQQVRGSIKLSNLNPSADVVAMATDQVDKGSQTPTEVVNNSLLTVAKNFITG